MGAPKRKRAKQPQQSGVQRKVKKLKGVQKPPPFPELKDTDYEVTEEDIELVEQFKDHIGFLKDLDQQKLDKSIGQVVDKGPKIIRPRQDGRKSRIQADDAEEEEDDDIQDYERRPRGQLQEEVDPGETISLPIKSLDGQVVNQEDDQQQLKAEQLESVPGVSVVDEWSKPSIYQHKLPQQIKKQRQKLQQEEQEKPIKEKNLKTNGNIIVNSEMFEIQNRQAEIMEEQNKESIQEKYERLKTRIAVGCMRLMENPEENMIDLRPIVEILKDTDERIVALCMLSLFNVFVNVIPGYRIRPPTEQELQIKQKKEVQKVRNYENKLLANYQKYLQYLLEHSKKSGTLCEISVRCLCGMLERAPHFNYTHDILQAIVQQMGGKDPNIRQQCCNAISNILSRDFLGEIGLSVVQLVADLVKRQKCKCSPEIVSCLLVLQFRELKPPAQEGDQQQKNMKQKKKLRKKRRKKGDEVDLAFKETMAEVDKEEAEIVQSQALEALFEIFFRVLKDCAGEINTSSGNQKFLAKSQFPLMIPTFQGLSKYGHLLSVEYMSDLVTVCTDILKTENLITIRDKCQCVSALCDLLSGHGEALSVDRVGLFQQLYKILQDIIIEGVWDDDDQIQNLKVASIFDVFIKPLHFLFCEVRQTDLNRVAAVCKRCGSIALHGGLKETLGSLSMIYKLLIKHYKLRRMVEFEGQGSGHFPYNQDAEDPSQANALNSTLWELFLLQKHFNPSVGRCAEWIIKQFQENPANSKMSLLSGVLGPIELVEKTDDFKGVFENAFRSQPKVNKKNKQQDKLLDLDTDRPVVDADHLFQKHYLARKVYMGL
eukprot:TRINITY_DN11801_c0_g2_i1.p1 TRINITY_DN11801_c0_g2~~TRINITY_DN11801_c0_g2_i1.p1  ORF type:complete len:859 (+),score=152.31 TRINITY_DN11801_c0_g2_i1:104-2578(+)